MIWKGGYILSLVRIVSIGVRSLGHGRSYSTERDYDNHSQELHELPPYSYKALKIFKLVFQSGKHWFSGVRL